MASNDSNAAVAAPVNAVTPIVLPSQEDNKGQEATQANHNASQSTTSTTQSIAAMPAVSDASAVTTKEVQKTESTSAQPPASNDTSSPSIPTSNTTETNKSDSSSSQPSTTDKSQSQSKPSEDTGKNALSATTTTTTAKANTDTTVATSSESKKNDSNGKEEKVSESVQKQEVATPDQQETAPPVKDNKEKQLATNESPSPNKNKDTDSTNSDKNDEKPSDKTQNASAAATTAKESAQAAVPSGKTNSSTPAPSKPVATIKPMVESTTASTDSTIPMDTSTSKSNTTSSNSKSNNKRPAEDGDEPSSDKKIKSSSTASSSGGGNNKEGSKTAKEVFEYMDKTFDQRRKIITKQMPTIPELKSMYPELFMCKQLLLEFQRITKIDIDQKIQEFCVRYATAVIEMARSNKAAAPVLARWEKAKQENETLKQYWDMVTALCLLPLHFGENFVEMVLEIEEDEEVKAQGKIVPTLVARGNIFRTDEFFLIAENTIVQEFEEFTIAFASLYSSYWVFNMVYPETIENTYNYIQRCIVRQREPGAISAVCKNFTKSLQKWNKDKEAK